ncbi:hypothetical protein AMJ40_01930 [candidate division TA06 bacterium DG_26]|uniref:Uncharacterized protein n=1 Tax=candidate division TA06 bacterium DG_26 TaxID=1703771 RepID=A0A0S7WKT7_UNCT6|nr:MAG: hypothetical protein AMJ40_01930 [candidate division TA06 bacterium DG_26]
MIEETDIERVAEEESQYLKELRDKYSRKDAYVRSLGFVKEFLAQKELDLESLTEFTKNEETGVVYVLVDERFRKLHHSLVECVLGHIRNETSVRELEKLSSTYEEEFRHAYAHFLSQRPEGALLFETVTRKLFGEGVDHSLSQHKFGAGERSCLIGEISARIDGILTPMRLNLSKHQKIDVFLFSETFSKSPLYPSALQNLTLVDIEAQLLKSGLTPTLFERVHRSFQSLIQKDLEQRIVDSIKKRAIRSKLDVLKSSEPLCSLSVQCVESIRQIITEKVSQKLAVLTQESKQVHRTWEDRKERFEQVMSEVMGDMRKALTSFREADIRMCADRFRQVTESVASEIDETREKRDKLEAELRSVRGLQNLSSEELTSLIARSGQREIERYFHVYHALADKFGRDLQHLPPEYTEPLSAFVKEEIALLRSKPSPSPEILSSLEEKRFWKRQYNTEELKRRWVHVCTEIIEPLTITAFIEELVSVWPPVIPERTLSQSLLSEARYVGEELAFKGKLYELDKPASSSEKVKERELEELRRSIVDDFKETVSVLVYDIRGSTFMGNKLNNATKESVIRNNFNVRMMEIAKAHGAFIVKDTGDGGILFFSGNSRELERIYRTEPEARLCEASLAPSDTSAKMAVQCATEMVQGAFNFVEENLEKYGDWFEDVRKESLRYAGITYAQLPPEYKSIFKVGVGIASGMPDIDIHFGLNGFGSPDITGGLVRAANLYSKARSKERSIILCDAATLISFLLNVDEYEPQGPEPIRTKTLQAESPSELLREAMCTYVNLKKRKRGYKFGKLSIAIERIGSHIFRQEDLEGDFTVSSSGLRIVRGAEFVDERDRRLKVLYQIIPEWMK